MKNFGIRLGANLVLLLLLSGCLLAVPQNPPAKAQQKSALVFDVKATKQVYTKGEAIEFNFTLLNGGKDALVVPRQFQLSLNVVLRITDSRGSSAQWCGRIAEVIPSKNLYRTLSPGESMHGKLNIRCVGQENPGRAWGYDLRAPGKYIVEATYRLPQPKEVFDQLFPGREVVRGPLSAEPINIELQ